MRGFPQPKRLRARRVEFSLRQLEATQREMVADRTAGTIDLLYDLDIDVTLNAPVVVFAVPLLEEIHLRRARIRGDVIVRDGPLAEGFVCSSQRAAHPISARGSG